MAAEMPGGFAGKILRIDLTNERVTTEDISPATARKFLGGAGLGAKILWEEVPPNVTWDSPENRLIMASGPLAGSPVWGTGSLCVVTKGAMTGGATSTQAQGFFGTNLKYSGYDAIVLQGKASRWVYVYIKDDTVELRDASHLLGKDTWGTQDALYDELGLVGHNLSVYGIGPAGEHLVRFAMIEGDYGHVASKNGCGAVMGSKNVKCVAIVRGTKGVRIQDPAGMYEAADEISYDVRTDPSSSSLYQYGTLPGPTNNYAAGALCIKNYQTNVFPEPDKLTLWEAPNIRGAFEHRRHQCNGCGMVHCHMSIMPAGLHQGEIVDEPESEGLAGCGPQLGITSPVDSTWLNTQVDKAGVDVNEWGWVAGWTIECLEKGYLTKEQVGIDVKWNDVESANKLLQMIARREGFGNLLAEGVKRAAEAIGGPAYDCAVFTMKGNTPRSHDHRGRWSELFDTAVGSGGTIESCGTVKPTEIGLPARVDPFDADEVARSAGVSLGRRQFEDSTGACIFTIRTSLELICRALNAVTGFDYDKEEAMTFGKRIAAMFRAYNLRCGIGPELERPSPRYGSTPINGPAEGQNILPHWDNMRRIYYDLNGYDLETGRPLPSMLRELGLEELVAQIWGTMVATSNK
ncbi:MAG: hypothetical protein EXR50_05085 [Dehalococcoidia bacterium]|nr:hypothetical protein [Dehalococcoidia bacterium]